MHGSNEVNTFYFFLLFYFYPVLLYYNYIFKLLYYIYINAFKNSLASLKNIIVSSL